jgi:hypothetical protein
MAGHRIAAGFAAGVLIKMLCGGRCFDMCAYRAICRPTLLALGMREMTYGRNLEMQMRMARSARSRTASHVLGKNPKSRATLGVDQSRTSFYADDRNGQEGSIA